MHDKGTDGRNMYHLAHGSIFCWVPVCIGIKNPLLELQTDTFGIEWKLAERGKWERGGMAQTWGRESGTGLSVQFAHYNNTYCAHTHIQYKCTSIMKRPLEHLHFSSSFQTQIFIWVTSSIRYMCGDDKTKSTFDKLNKNNKARLTSLSLVHNYRLEIKQKEWDQQYRYIAQM